MLHGAHVIFACRSVSNCEAARDAIVSTGVSGTGEVMALDLVDLDSVDAFGAVFTASGSPLHFLVNNGGIMDPGPARRFVSKQGYELQFAVNHLGHFRLSQLLAPALEATGTAKDPARLIILTSSGNQFWFGPATGTNCEGIAAQAERANSKPDDYHGLFNYIFSKALNTLNAKEQQRRWNESGAHVIATSVNPGLVATELLSNDGHGNIDTSNRSPFPHAFYGWGFIHGIKSLGQGASTTIHALLARP